MSRLSLAGACRERLKENMVRLICYSADGRVNFGKVDGEEVLPLPHASTLVEAVHQGRTHPARSAGRRLGDIRLLPPVGHPARNVFCVGWNYVEHFEEGQGRREGQDRAELPQRPTFFTKATGTVIGPNDPVSAHSRITQTLDWEAELALVIGTDGVDIPEERALDHVLGYMVANDVSARNVQRGHGGQWFRGKSLDRTCPLGPWLVTPDEIGELAPLAITCRVNGETVQAARLGDMHFSVPRIIAELSSGLTLRAGDVILTGTPSGVGFARNPPRYLTPGDRLETEIERIGVLRNHIVDAEERPT